MRHRYLPIRRGSRFFALLPQITCFLVKPRRVGPPSRHRYLPIRCDSRFFALLPQNTRFLAEPRRVGPSTRHGCLPIRRGSPYFSLFASNYLLPSRATSCWRSNATWMPSNTTRRPLLHQKTTRAIRVVAYLLYLSSNVQSSLKLDSSKRCSGKRRGPQELEPMPACL